MRLFKKNASKKEKKKTNLGYQLWLHWLFEFRRSGKGQIQWSRGGRVNFESKNLEDTGRGALCGLNGEVTMVLRPFLGCSAKIGSGTVSPMIPEQALGNL